MKNLWYIVLAVFLFVINGAWVCAEIQEGKGKEGTIFIYKFNPGEETKYQLTIEDKGKTSLNKSRTTTSQRIELIFRQKVESVDEEGTGSVIQFYERATVNRKKFALQGKKVTLRIAANGKVLESNGLNEIFEVIVRGGLTGIPGAEQIPVSLKGVNSNLFNSDYGKIWPIFPDRELKLGDSWEIPTSTLATGTLNVKYLFTGMEKLNNYDCAKIKIFYDVEKGNTLSGEMYFASSEGKIVGGNALVKLKSAIRVNISDHPLIIKLERETNYTLETLEKK